MYKNITEILYIYNVMQSCWQTLEIPSLVMCQKYFGIADTKLSWKSYFTFALLTNVSELYYLINIYYSFESYRGKSFYRLLN